MHICYVDESGCLGTLPSATSPVQPALIIAGISLDHAKVARLTSDFIALKMRFFPSLCKGQKHSLSGILTEIKGADIRKMVCSPKRSESRYAMGFLDNILKVLEIHDARLFGRIWIKAIGPNFNGKSVYAYSVQSICKTFQNYLTATDQNGIVIADHRTSTQNSSVSHSIFTQKFKSAGDSFDRILEMPTFGHSENHAGIQMTDLVCSAILFPMAVHTYCAGIVTSIHIKPAYALIKQRYGIRIKALQYRYSNGGIWSGGMTVSDGISKKSGACLFA